MAHQASQLERRVEWTRGFRCAADKAVLLALVRWYAWREDGTNVRPSNHDLAVRSQVPLRTVERALERLVAGHWLHVTERRPRARTTYRVDLDRLATADPAALKLAPDRDGMTARVAVIEADDRQSGGHTLNDRHENRPDFNEVAVIPGTTTTYVLSTCTDSSSSTSRHSGGHPDVATFLAWWPDAYASAHHGARSHVEVDRHGPLIADLLRVRRLDEIQAMTVLMWQLPADHDPKSDRSWIARSDHSIHVLYAKADYLDRVVAAPAPVAQQLAFGPMEDVPLSRREVDEARHVLSHVYGRCPHEPRHTVGVDCIREIALARRVGA